MSLSEAPSVKITFRTPQDISDEILGGTIRFCEETGYKQNIMMLTFLWSGFLLSSRKQLDEHGLVEDILNCYTRSLGQLFPKLTEDAALKNQVGEMLQHYWGNLNHDFEDIRNEEQSSVFLQIANKLNSQDDVSSTYLLNKDPREPFAKIANVLQSSIYRILHQIDNGMGIQYRGIVQYPFLHQQTKTAKPTPQVQSSSATIRTTESQTESGSIPWKKIIIGLIIGIVLIVAIVNAVSNYSTSSKPSNQDSSLVAVQEPRSGEILLGQEVVGESELTITASGGSSCVVKLKTSSGVTRLSFFVRAGDTVTVGVPAEYLYVYFASGETWYGETHLFGSETSYSMDDEIKDFTQYTWSYTLYPVTNGNFSETPIDPEDF